VTDERAELLAVAAMALVAFLAGIAFAGMIAYVERARRG
jgi:hypothetical protein